MRQIVRYALALVLAAGVAEAQPGFSKSFAPSAIGPGNISTLRFAISNAGGDVPVTGLAFTDDLPAGVVIATPSAATSTCSPGRDGTPITIDAPNGGGTIAVSGGAIPAGSACTVSVNVTAGAIGTYTNTSSALTSSAGQSPAATADLTVSADVPGFSKAFSPSAVPLGARSRLTFTVDNTVNAAAVTTMTFSDALPTGVTIADPANVVTTCQGSSEGITPTITAEPGAGGFAYSYFGFNSAGFQAVVPGETCTVAVDVRVGAFGALENTSSDLTFSNDGGAQSLAGKAGAIVTGVRDEIVLDKAFTDDPILGDGSGTIAYALRSLDRNAPATDITFTDDLAAVGSGIQAQGLPLAACGGTVSSSDGGFSILFSGGSVQPGETCSFELTFTATGLLPGTYASTTSAVSGTIGGTPVSGLPASAELFVGPPLVFTKTFIDDPVTPGSPVTLEFTIENVDAGSAVSEISFEDVLTTILPYPVAVTLPPSPDPPCGVGSALTLVNTTFPDESTLTLTGGSLDIGASCTFAVAVAVPTDAIAGTFTSTTEPIMAVTGGTGPSLAGQTASDDLVIAAGARLTKSFSSAASPGGQVTLAFRLSLSASAPTAATGIGFSDDLDAALTGLSYSGADFAACGGTVSTPITGGTLAFTGGELEPGETCDFEVPLDVPADAAGGTYTNTTSDVTSTVDGMAITSGPATADLTVTVVALAKQFVPSRVTPATGGDPSATVDLEFTITNASVTSAATDLVFTDNLGDVLSGLTPTGLPASDVCGTGSTLQSSGASFLIFTGGVVPAEGDCTFTVTLTVPNGAAPGDYTNVTSPLSGTVDGASFSSPAASARLTVDDPVSAPPSFAKSFAPTEIAVGQQSVLTLAIANESGFAATDLAVVDVLPSGLVVADGSATTDCSGATLTADAGSDTITLADGSLAVGAACTVTVPVTSDVAGTYENTTGDLTSSLGNSGTASATLTVTELELVATKAVQALTDRDGSSDVAVGDAYRYTVTVTPSGSRTVTEVRFDDTPDPLTTLLAGTVSIDKGDATILSGNTLGDTSVAIDLGSIAPSETVTITFNVRIDGPLPEAGGAVCNQGTFSSGFGAIPTDDASTAEVSDATCLTVEPAPFDIAIESVTAERGQPLPLPGTLANRTSQPEDVSLRIELVAPTGATLQSEILRTTVPANTTTAPAPLAPSLSLSARAPAGEYTATVSAVRRSDGTVLDEDTFTFSLPAGAGGAPGSGDDVFATAADDESLEAMVPTAGPNPFTGRTTVRFGLARSAAVDLRVFDVTGREVAVLSTATLGRGVHAVDFDASAQPVGVYLWRLVVDGEVTTGRVTLVR